LHSFPKIRKQTTHIKNFFLKGSSFQSAEYIILAFPPLVPLIHNDPKLHSTITYPLCAIEMKNFMFAAKDTPTCMRKTEVSNPIGSKSDLLISTWFLKGMVDFKRSVYRVNIG